MTLEEKILQAIGGMHPAAIATIDGGRPAVRFMVLNGFPDMTLVGGTLKASRKVAQLRQNPETSIAIWSGKEYTDPFVVIRARGEVHEDLATKQRYWNQDWVPFFRKVENPDYVALVFTAYEIEWSDPIRRSTETWKRK